MDSYIKVRKAKEHNLREVSVDIPKNKLITFTGVSGSGKSSLAMDTIYAEGQRRYIESLSSYARQFLGVMKKPDVESIEGLSPAIAIDQKTVSHNPRSTVGTVTEVYDYLRLLFARIGHPHCPECGHEIQHLSVDQIVTQIIKDGTYPLKGRRLLILSPLVKDRKGEYSKMFENLKRQGYSRVRVDNQLYNLSDDISLIKTNKHSIDVVIDRLVINSRKKISSELTSRLTQSVESALHLGNGYIIVVDIKDASFEFPDFPKNFTEQLFSERFACPSCNISLPEIEPRTFSFNSPHGACKACLGIGTQLKIDENSIIAPELSVLEGGLIPWASLMEKKGWNRLLIETVAKTYNIDLNIPVKSLSKSKLDLLKKGIKNKKFKVKANSGNTYYGKFEGLIQNLERRYLETNSDYVKTEIEKYMVKEPCPVCNGKRLSNSALSVTILNYNISEVSDLPIKMLFEWICDVEKADLSKREHEIAESIILEIKARLKFLLDVGLTYLTISRSSSTLAGGEAQRIRLASQIGSRLSGVLYVLDEPSIGLHPRDHARLIATLKELRDLGNTVIVVEHDEQTMLESDYIIDFGPNAGENGGQITAIGTPDQIKKNKNSLTGDYLSGRKKIDADNYLLRNGYHDEIAFGVSDRLSKAKTEGRARSKSLKILGCKGHNLKNINVEIPLGKFVCVTGVSGSGKSTLIDETLLRMLRQEKGLKNDLKPEENKGIIGTENIDKVISIDQAPIGRTPRSNPATYTKLFDYIRELFTQSNDAKIRGYKPGRFSFNVKGGRCESCQGDGQIKIAMHFMPDVYVDCEVCGGKRYNRETLEIEYRGKNIADILEMTVEEAFGFFANHHKIHRRLSTLHDVGLGYIKLGQPAPTLSGGEAQRVKLAAELAKVPTGNTFYILDEPTTGLHFADLERLIAIIKRLVSRDNTVLVIEHNLEVIKTADWIIDLGPDGGMDGGKIVFSGTIDNMLKNSKTYTAIALRKFLNRR